MGEPDLANVRIILVEPAGPRNVGAIARVMKNMGLQQLVLVNPQCDPLGDEARQMAVHAGDILEAAQRVATLPDGLQGCYRAIATTARSRTLTVDLESPQVALPWLLEVPSALIFGREDHGLTNLELNYAQRYVTIPAHPQYLSLNLAQSVGICCYELYQSVHRQAASIHQLPDGVIGTEIAPLDELERYFQHLENLLLKIGYLYPHTAASRMGKFRQLYKRSGLTKQEVALLQGVLSQVEWALQQPPSRSAIDQSAVD
ncbi:RNA methyltransferase [Neosynechococcus sphagnicola sy1]|uniref:tRNA (cytidine/uridine-2'-O-)-methyltransferase TrmJ n=1 Tax=Neosynechococcus sphagnicola sy1 TaxID=1497020 RepID=A0A098TJM6_9CYAN|nr:RNA methyltransferase [Neosynechococcus sphagnicola]KGF72499.1 RNA methyltransferase [Neosynechococcus sphagnicola sy1]